jgi:hypothetical protein
MPSRSTAQRRAELSLLARGLRGARDVRAGGLDPAELDACGLLYLSGITLAILSEGDRERLVAQMARHKAAGT